MGLAPSATWRALPLHLPAPSDLSPNGMPAWTAPSGASKKSQGVGEEEGDGGQGRLGLEGGVLQMSSGPLKSLLVDHG